MCARACVRERECVSETYYYRDQQLLNWTLVSCRGRAALDTVIHLRYGRIGQRARRKIVPKKEKRMGCEAVES